MSCADFSRIGIADAIGNMEMEGRGIRWVDYKGSYERVIENMFSPLPITTMGLTVEYTQITRDARKTTNGKD